MIRIAAVFVTALLAALPAAAQQEFRFDPMPALSCLAGAPDLAARRACIGLGAQACMATNEFGETTYGMGACFDQARAFWDQRLNVAYGQLMASDKATDAEMASIGASVPSLAEGLRDMQRAWIPYRDAACDYERAQWGNGTGGGPATLACLMQLTGEQALKLEQRLLEQ